MIRLKDFINEDTKLTDIYRLGAVTASYDCAPPDMKDTDVIVMDAPGIWNESDIQQYLDDRFLNFMPGSSVTDDEDEKSLAQVHFGVNADSIYDVYFTYEKFEHLSQAVSNSDMKYDPAYARGATAKGDVKLECFKITGLKYVLKFNRFDMQDTDDSTVKDNIYKIFMAAASNDVNRYPLYVTMPDGGVEYEKQ